MARTTNEKPIKLSASFEHIVRTLLQTPPPPAGTPRSLAKKARTRQRALLSSTRTLKAQFDAAHRDGMKALREGNYENLGKAIKRERAIAEKQKVLIARQRRVLTTRRTRRLR